MAQLSPIPVPRRAPRVRFSEVTPTVLRFPDGRRVPGTLQVISLTGGLLLLSPPLDQGSFVKLIFVTGAGPVMGSAEMLNPVSDSLQPFRFVDLHRDDESRLHTAIQSSLPPMPSSSQFAIEKYRAW